MQIPPYYSIEKMAPRIFHDRDDCPEARALPAWYRMSGTGGFVQCPRCQDLAEIGSSVAAG